MPNGCGGTNQHAESHDPQRKGRLRDVELRDGNSRNPLGHRARAIADPVQGVARKGKQADPAQHQE